VSQIYEQIIQYLNQHGVPYRAVHHEPTRTSEESAKARGEDVRIGGKALLVKVRPAFVAHLEHAGICSRR
jgi:Ala-tRNA(Pro) deacylase